MKWNKIKHLFVANQQSKWMHSHASNAVFYPLNETIGRVYFSCRDINGKSHIAFLDIDFSTDFKIIKLSKEPVISPGPLGTFDDSGVVMGCIHEINGMSYLYYLGWNLKITVPWLNTIGLAIGNASKGEFKKYSMAPIMDRSNEDPYSISYPSIVKDNERYQMWYGSNLSWGKNEEDMKHVFKYATSKDGIHWKRTNKTVLNFEHPNEYALSKPWVLKDKNGYKMWYSYRGNGTVNTYRIGYAESKDGINWIRKDDLAGINVSTNGWDSQMISYPNVFKFMDKTFMLYNGNEYGKTGFGIAELVES